VAVIRPFNTYGPRQSARAVIPTIITQIATGASEIRLGALHPTRDFNFVADTVRGFVAVAQADAAIGRVINIGSDYEISIADTAALIAERMGHEVRITCENERLRPEGSEVERLWGSNALARELTDWQPEYANRDGLARGLDETIAWFTDPTNLVRYKTDVYNI
jgi:nucleoside-diphosphate-sugar epimerase